MINIMDVTIAADPTITNLTSAACEKIFANG